VLSVAACSKSDPDDLAAAGAAAVARDDHVSAILHWKTALQADPGRDDVRWELGRSLAELGQFDAALVEFGKLAERPQQASRAVPALASVMVQSGEYKKLVLQYGQTDLKDPQANAQLQAELAAAYVALGQVARARSAVEAALKQVPNFAPALLWGARLVAGEGNFAGAQALVQRVLEADPSSARAWLLKAELLDAQGLDSANMLAAYRKSVALSPRCVDCHSALIMHHLRRRDLDAVRTDLDALRKMVPGHAFVALIDSYLALDEGRLELARERAQALLKLFPDHPGVLALAGAVESRMGLHGQAAAYLGKSLAINPRLNSVRIQLAGAQLQLGRIQQGLGTLAPLLKNGADDPAALALAASAYLRLGDVSAANQAFERAKRANPGDLRLRTSAAALRLEGGDATAGIAELTEISGRTTETFADEALLAAHLRRHEYKQALEVIDRISRKAPSSLTSQELRGRVLLAMGDISAARETFERAAAAHPTAFGPVGSLVAMEVTAGRPAAGLDRLRAFIEKQPQDPEALLALARLAVVRASEPVPAVKAMFEAAVTAAPAARAPRLELIGYLLQQRRPKEALTAAQAARAVLPDDPDIVHSLGQAQMQAGELEQAITTFRELAGASGNAPQPYLSLAQAYLLTREPARAETALRQALEFDPGYEPAQNALVNLLESSRRPAEALAHAKALRERRPKDPTGYVLESDLLARRGDVDQAASILRLGIERAQAGDLAERLVSLYVRAKRLDEAADVGASWLKRAPADPDMELLMSGVDILRSDLRSAEQRLERVVQARPANAEALNNLAAVQLKLGRAPDRATALARRALGVAPDQPAYKDTLARGLAAQGQFDEALRVQREAVSASPDDAELRFTLAEIALKAGDRVAARSELTRLRDMANKFPRQAEVTKLLQGL
jgi:putative PEP-CTERM system TPR-repeat lipoprotein